jgi:nucleoid-associated protein YgaU
VEADHAKPGDTFADVSARVYGSDKYGRALLLFNREDPRNRDKENLLRDPVRLLPGQPVFYPPKEVLEGEPRFAALIGSEPRPAPAPSANPPSVLGTPTPLITNPGNPKNAAVNPPAPPVPAGKGAVAGDNTRRYRVGDNGEHILEIARKTLGDQRRWPAIYQLNPSIRPEYPIPGGTELRLPASASLQ